MRNCGQNTWLQLKPTEKLMPVIVLGCCCCCFFSIYVSVKCDGVIPGIQSLNSIGDIEKHLLYLALTQTKISFLIV